MEAQAELREQPERRNHKYNRRRIGTLERRANHLASRIGSPGSESYDEAEYQALRWAIRSLKEWMNEDPYWVFDPPPGGGAGGQWRELGHAYWDEWRSVWRTREDKHSVRPATDKEIAEAKTEGEQEHVH